MYDSVLHQAPGEVPPRFVNIMKFFHEGIKTFVSVNGENTSEFGVRNGLRQGCTINPTYMVVNS